MPRALLATLAGLTATLLFTAGAAFADVGPPPKCAAGSHDEYRYGHHCVPDGSHLAESPDGGGFAVVPDSPEEAAAKAQSTVAAPPADRGCACGVAAGGEGAAGLLAGLGILAALARRRRPR